MKKEKSKKYKKFEEYKESSPIQLPLFYNTVGSERNYTNTINLYDTLPKYYHGNQPREKGEKGEYLPILKRKFEDKGIEYSLDISPASIFDEKSGKTIQYYPSQREELVEDVLRKLVCEGRGTFLDDEVGFTFSLYEIQRELQENGHGYNINEIKDALNICADATIKIKSSDGEISFTSPIFSTLGLKGVENQTKTFVRFHPLVTKSIKEKTFRQLHYKRYMAHKRTLSRWFHKRLSHYFVQASEKNAYNIKLTTIVSNSGMNFHAKVCNTKIQIIKSLEELVENEILSSFEMKPIKEGKDKRKITDWIFYLYPHKLFVRDIVKSHLKKKKISKFTDS